MKKKDLSREAPSKFAPVSRTSVTSSSQLKQKVCATFFLLKTIVSEIQSNMEALVDFELFNCTNGLSSYEINLKFIFLVNNKILKF